MFTRKSIIAVTSIILLTTFEQAYAILGSDACRNVTFTVNNHNTRPIEVLRFELHSVDEGRWLNENFRNVRVPANTNNFVVRFNETVEYAEGDDIDEIRVHFRIRINGHWVERVALDTDIDDHKCVADRRYNATVPNVDR